MHSFLELCGFWLRHRNSGLTTDTAYSFGDVRPYSDPALTETSASPFSSSSSCHVPPSTSSSGLSSVSVSDSTATGAAGGVSALLLRFSYRTAYDKSWLLSRFGSLELSKDTVDVREVIPAREYELIAPGVQSLEQGEFLLLNQRWAHYFQCELGDNSRGVHARDDTDPAADVLDIAEEAVVCMGSPATCFSSCCSSSCCTSRSSRASSTITLACGIECTAAQSSPGCNAEWSHVAARFETGERASSSSDDTNSNAYCDHPLAAATASAADTSHHRISRAVASASSYGCVAAAPGGCNAVMLPAWVSAVLGCCLS